MNNTIRIIAVVLLIFVALGALYAGYSFITTPSGQGMSMDTSYLAHSPFRDFFIPGIVLFVVNGVFNIIAAIAAIIKTTNYFFYIMMQGILLSGWIIVQIIMARDVAVQHLLSFSIGVIFICIGIILRKEKRN